MLCNIKVHLLVHYNENLTVYGNVLFIPQEILESFFELATVTMGAEISKGYLVRSYLLKIPKTVKMKLIYI